MHNVTTSCGGGIGVLVGDFQGGTVSGNLVARNSIRGRLRVPGDECGGYDDREQLHRGPRVAPGPPAVAAGAPRVPRPVRDPLRPASGAATAGAGATASLRASGP